MFQSFLINNSYFFSVSAGRDSNSFILSQRLMVCLCWGISKILSTQGRDSLLFYSSMTSNIAGMAKLAPTLCFRYVNCGRGQLWDS